MKLLIATPTASGHVTTGYVHTVTAVHRIVQQAGGVVDFTTCDGANVSIARNILTARFLQSVEYDQLLFIDGDMKLDETIVEEILTSKFDVCGAIYPRRSLRLETLRSNLDDGQPFSEAFNSTLQYDVFLEHGGEIQLGSFVAVERIGMGFFRVSRNVLNRMIDKRVVEERRSWAAESYLGREQYFGFFSEEPLDYGDFVGEDFSFCDRLRKVDEFKIMGIASPSIKHQGIFDFSIQD